MSHQRKPLYKNDCASWKPEFSPHSYSSKSVSLFSLSDWGCLHIRELINYFLLTWQDLGGKAKRSSCLCGNLEPALRLFKWLYFHTVIQVRKSLSCLIPGLLVVIAPVLIAQSRSCWRQACEWLDTCVCTYVHLCLGMFACLVWRCVIHVWCLFFLIQPCIPKRQNLFFYPERTDHNKGINSMKKNCIAVWLIIHYFACMKYDINT